jgi:DNA polymerase V
MPANSVRIPFYPQVSKLPIDNSLSKKSLDLNNMYINNPEATFFVRAQGASAENINTGDVLVVDRSLTARHGDTVIACTQGRMSVITLKLNPDVLLRPKNKAYAAASTPIPTKEASSLEVFGVVISVVRQLDRV